MPTQRTYTCRCSKKHELPRLFSTEQVTKKCGCGRVATIKGTNVTITDKEKKK